MPPKPAPYSKDEAKAANTSKKGISNSANESETFKIAVFSIPQFQTNKRNLLLSLNTNLVGLPEFNYSSDAEPSFQKLMLPTPPYGPRNNVPCSEAQHIHTMGNPNLRIEFVLSLGLVGREGGGFTFWS
ncbi:hypothetical protein DSO57_1034745 [Entomophthora muscae]|uniref:Uncharacterized protein n=1 Tax=Entomophthora muscae TaxID=34485 RepID=A0ACC2TAE4_9FUNG|nr:hypothetical protein DSO57_1034745 [Entomophthora muscae]